MHTPTRNSLTREPGVNGSLRPGPAAARKDDMGAPDQANAAIYTFRAYKSRTNDERLPFRSDGAATSHPGVGAAAFVEELGKALEPHHLAIVHQPNRRRWPPPKIPGQGHLERAE